MSACKYADKEYSEGSEICQEGQVKKCVAGEWRDTDRDCRSSKDKSRPSQSDVATVIASLPHGEGDPPTGQVDPSSNHPPDSPRTVIRFIDERTLRQFPGHVYFRAARTRGNVCIGQLDPGDYTIGREDIEYLENPGRRCSSNPSIRTREIRYVVG